MKIIAIPDISIPSIELQLINKYDNSALYNHDGSSKSFLTPYPKNKKPNKYDTVQEIPVKIV